MVTGLGALQAGGARASVYGSTSEYGGGNDGPVRCGEHVCEPTLACMNGARALDQPSVHSASRESQQEREKACTLIQAWWRMRLVVLALMHSIRVRDIKALARRCRTLDNVIDSGTYLRHLPAVHDLCV